MHHWTFTQNGDAYKIKMTGNRASNDGDLVRRWCVAGRGLTVKSCLDVSKDIISRRLVRVLPEFTPRATELWLICPSRQSITPAVRLLRDKLREKCADILQSLLEEGVITKKEMDGAQERT